MPLNQKPDDKAAELRLKARQADTRPGVYLMKAASGKILYVGKAKNLRKRLASYFLKAGPADVKTRTLLGQVADFETIVTGTEKEALLLESNLIKRHRPRYNVVLKDDKRYPLLRLDLNHPFPNLTIVRKVANDGAAYFGPYASAQAVRQTLKFINKYFCLRKCKNRDFSKRRRPCLHHQMDACYGPCCLDVDEGDYRKVVDEVVLFLKGRTPELVQRLRREIQRAVDKLAFEEAARLRDRMRAMEITLERQRAVTRDRRDRDVITLASQAQVAVVHVLSVLGGYLQGSRSYRMTQSLAEPAEITSAFIRQLYPPGAPCPHEILTAAVPTDVSLLEDWLRAAHEHPVKVLHPLRGEKKRLLEMGRLNAEKALKEHLAVENRRRGVLERLGRRLGMPSPPRRIECFDNSNLFGKAAVSGMVVFEEGQPRRSQYRKFNVRGEGRPDDYAAMEQVLTRRFTNHPSWPHPDLLLLDGGKGQLNIALDVVRRIGLAGAFVVAAIAKKEEERGEEQDKIYLPQRVNPVNFAGDEEALLLLQRVRDEAHRFAVQFHRGKRNKAALVSTLDGIPGIGPKRKLGLLRHFGSLQAIRAATLDELSVLPGMNRKAAEAVQRCLRADRDQRG